MKLPKFLSYPAPAREVPKMHAREVPRKGNQLWHWHCQNRREKKFCDNAIAEIEGEKFCGMDLWQWHCQNRREKKNCDNDIAEIEGEKKLLQLICQKLEERQRVV